MIVSMPLRPSVASLDIIRKRERESRLDDNNQRIFQRGEKNVKQNKEMGNENVTGTYWSLFFGLL